MGRNVKSTMEPILMRVGGHRAGVWRLVSIACIGSICSHGLVMAETSTGVSLVVSSVKYDYVVREPVKFVVRLGNNSPKTINIPTPRNFDMNMRFLRIEVTTPSGETQIRMFKYIESIRLVGHGYSGEPLAAGASIETFLYPNVSFFIVHPRQLSPREGVHLTFPEPGRYQLRVIYLVSTAMENLWKGPDGELYSDPIDLAFREPDAVEKEILDALWSRGGGILSMGDNFILGHFDEQALRQVIGRYPDHEMTLYARFALARSLLSSTESTTNIEIDEATEILTELMRNHAGFRPMEVRQHLATAFEMAGRNEEAVDLFAETLLMYPALKDHYRFMQWYIITNEWYVEAISDWRERRRAGDTKAQIKKE